MWSHPCCCLRGYATANHLSLLGWPPPDGCSREPVHWTLDVMLRQCDMQDHHWGAFRTPMGRAAVLMASARLDLGDVLTDIVSFRGVRKKEPLAELPELNIPFNPMM